MTILSKIISCLSRTFDKIIFSWRNIIDIQLIKNAQNNDQIAIENLFARYDLYIFKLVFSFATRISLLAEIDDLKAEANIAFLDAVKSFDPEMNVNFSVYLRCIV